MNIVFDLTSLTYWGPFSPDTLKEKGRMLGGTEGCSLYLAKTMAQLGNEVTVFRSSENKEREEYDGVQYMPSEAFLPYTTMYSDTDIIISANCGMRNVFANKEINAKLKVDYVSCASIYMSPEYEENTDIFLYMSNFQKKYLLKCIPPDRQAAFNDKLLAFRFGYDPEIVNNLSYNERENRIIYASSPDRGLHDAIEIFKEMHKTNPDLELHVFYDIMNWLNQHKYSMYSDGQRAASILSNYNTPGLVFRGPTSYVDMQKEFGLAKALVYPFSAVQPTETSPRTVIEAIAAGTPVFLSNNDCLEELYKDHCYVKPINIKQWASDINNIITDKEKWEWQVTMQFDSFDCEWQTCMKELLTNLEKKIK